MPSQTFNDVLIDGNSNVEQLAVQGHTTQTAPLQTWENSSGTVLAQVDGNGQLLVVGSQDIPLVRVQAHSTQTEPLQAWEAFGGGVLSQITNDGRLEVGNNAIDAVPAALVVANQTIDAGSLVRQGIQSRGVASNAITEALTWNTNELEFGGAGGVSSTEVALRGKVVHNNTGNSVNGDFRGGHFEVENQTGTSGQRVGQATGVHGRVTNGPSSSTAYLNKAAAVRGEIVNGSGDTIDEASAFEVVTPTNTGSIGTFYGLRIPDLPPALATNRYAIQTGQGVARFGDTLEIGELATPPSTPPAGFARIYAKSDGRVYSKNDAGVESDLTLSLSQNPNVFYAGPPSGSAAAPGFRRLAASDYDAQNQLCQGRLTLISGTPIATGDVTGGSAANLYFTPFRGNLISLYNGSTWVTYSFSELSLSLSGKTANTNYDVFIYDNAGTLTLEVTAWSNNSTRATQLALQNGVYVKSGATTRRYLGTIRITATTGQSEDSDAKRFVWNYYNGVPRRLMAQIPGVWAIASWPIGWRKPNNQAYGRVEVVVGLAETLLELRATVGAWANTGYASIGIGEDRENGNDAHMNTRIYSAVAGEAGSVAVLSKYPQVGYHYYQQVEYVTDGPVTFVGTDSTNKYFQAGILGGING